jgi:hypothetical protein
MVSIHGHLEPLLWARDKVHQKHGGEHMLEQSCSPHGIQEGQRERKNKDREREREGGEEREKKEVREEGGKGERVRLLERKTGDKLYSSKANLQ